MRYNNIEVMAPVGSWESLSAAIKGGCNSVYFGIEQLNMRARSSINFTTEDLAKIAEICKENNIKSYITLNTVLYDHDITLMKSIIDAAKTSGIDAVIASDHAAMNYAKKIGFPVHISTQCNISNVESVEFYANFADVMVMARELSLQQVGSISAEIEKKGIKGPSGENVEVEVFAHGALCMAVSGKCYLSLHSHNSSANRGACIQNCRREYTVIDKEEGIELDIDNEYIMSAKDLATIDFLDKVLDAGVKVLKIEGRGITREQILEGGSCLLYTGDKILKSQANINAFGSLNYKGINGNLIIDEDIPGGATAYILNELLENQNAYQYLDSKPITLTAKPHRPAYGTDGDYFSKPNAEDIFESIYGIMQEANPSKFKKLY